MWRVTVNVTLSTNGSKICSFFIKSILRPHDIWKQRQNPITSWCVWDLKKNHGECHIFNQSEQSCLEMLTFLNNEIQILPPWLLCGFSRPPGDFFTFNQPDIKYLYVIWCFLHIEPCRFHNIPPSSVGTRPFVQNLITKIIIRGSTFVNAFLLAIGWYKSSEALMSPWSCEKVSFHFLSSSYWVLNLTSTFYDPHVT